MRRFAGFIALSMFRANLDRYVNFDEELQKSFWITRASDGIGTSTKSNKRCPLSRGL